jgi:hypothetical protein
MYTHGRLDDMPQVLIRKIDALLAEELFEWADVNDISGKLMGISPESV